MTLEYSWAFPGRYAPSRCTENELVAIASSDLGGESWECMRVCVPACLGMRRMGSGCCVRWWRCVVCMCARMRKGTIASSDLGKSEAMSEGMGEGNQSLRVVRQVEPTYPSTAKQAEIEGKVTLSFTVNPDGTVSNIEIVDANPPRMFDAAAKQAMSRWQFEPATENGQAVAKRATQTLNFQLNN